MPEDHVDYNHIAPTYNRRYTTKEKELTRGVGEALLALARELGAARVLEVGCGTCHWLTRLGAVTPHLYGLDLSAGMLQQAQERETRMHLVRGRADRLPFARAVFDLIFCVNAFHHFDHKRAFVVEARRLLRPGGALAVVGMNPQIGTEQYYIYEYFKGTCETDLRRFASWGTVLDWMAAAGFGRVEWCEAARIADDKIGRGVLDDPFLGKDATSQLTLLTDEEYAAGIRRIKDAVAEAEAAGETLVFPVDIPLGMVVGFV